MRTQTLALILGIAVYVVLTLIDVDIIAERRELLLIFSVLFIGMLKIWGVDRGGNKSWLDFPFLPFNIQPAEICKIFYILILAKVISVEENKISSPLTVFKIAGITLLLAGEIILVSDEDVYKRQVSWRTVRRSAITACSRISGVSRRYQARLPGKMPFF